MFKSVAYRTQKLNQPIVQSVKSRKFGHKVESLLFTRFNTIPYHKQTCNTNVSLGLRNVNANLKIQFRTLGTLQQISTLGTVCSRGFSTQVDGNTQTVKNEHQSQHTKTSTSSDAEILNNVRKNNEIQAKKVQEIESVHKERVWKIQRPLTSSQMVKAYMDLSKDKLTAFVVLTAMAGYAIAPAVGTGGIESLLTLAYLTAGTSLCSMSANSINQWAEVPYDLQMSRTRNRPIARCAIEPRSAMFFGLTSGVLGVTSLSLLVNPVTGMLGLANIVLYAFVYTPMKRITIYNTWVGAVVGAIPPLMGWTAVTAGATVTGVGSVYTGGVLLGLILFAWQFPHFNSLAYTLRKEYSSAGYRMMSVLDPKMNSRVALRYSVLMFPLCYLMSYFQVTDYWFALDSSLVNGYMLYFSYRFHQARNLKTSRSMFFASLVHLPIILILLIIHKLKSEDETKDNRDGGKVIE